MAGRSSAHSMGDLRRRVWPAGARGRVVAEWRLAGSTGVVAGGIRSGLHPRPGEPRRGLSRERGVLR